jgi:uncharacterized protein YndB with AHSA1/START domain
MIDPLRMIFDVACDQVHAFSLWTEGSALWWPVSHTTRKEKGTAIVFEPYPGGRVYELGPAGDEVEWGSILAWEPPTRLVYRWHIFSDSRNATEVEVRFRINNNGTTTVELEHRGWDAFLDGEERRERNAIGWRGLIAAYVAACTDEAGIRSRSDRN